MSRLTIHNIGIDTHAVNKFFENWFPENLESLFVNQNSTSKDQAKMGDYIDSLTLAINGVTFNVLLCKSIVLFYLKYILNKINIIILLDAF